MPAARTARERARVELTAEITAVARRHVAASGAAALSLRAVARELGMVSSALYRYFPSRDDLLTTLIVDSYCALAARMRAADSGAGPRERWASVCNALRTWAIAHPHEYALIYGTPVPGYRAPAGTVQPAAEVILVLLGVVRAATTAGSPVQADLPVDLAPELAAQLTAVQSDFADGVPLAVLARLFQAFGQLFGAISLELFGHFVGTADPAGPLYDLTVAELADRLGLAGATVPTAVTLS